MVIADLITQQYGGKISFQSIEGIGTTFSFYFKLDPEEIQINNVSIELQDEEHQEGPILRARHSGELLLDHLDLIEQTDIEFLAKTHQSINALSINGNQKKYEKDQRIK